MDTTYLIQFHVVCFVDNAVCSLSDFLLKLKSWTAFNLFLFELLSLLLFLHVMRNVFFQNLSELALTLAGCVARLGLVVLHALVGIFVDGLRLAVVLQRCDSACPTHIYVLRLY